jgi:hypothetical protein
VQHISNAPNQTHAGRDATRSRVLACAVSAAQYL